jgi:hypothetical protein
MWKGSGAKIPLHQKDKNENRSKKIQPRCIKLFDKKRML